MKKNSLQIIAIALSGLVSGWLISSYLGTNVDKKNSNLTAVIDPGLSLDNDFKGPVLTAERIDWNNITITLDGDQDFEDEFPISRGRASEYYTQSEVVYNQFSADIDQLTATLRSTGTDCATKRAIFDAEWEQIAFRHKEGARLIDTKMTDDDLTSVKERVSVIEALRADFLPILMQKQAELRSVSEDCLPEYYSLEEKSE